MFDVNEVYKCIHYRFQQVKLLETALTHSSFANESGDGREHNERLEFLGDAVLELSVTQQLFERFPSVREGELTKLRARLVSKPSLADMSFMLGLDKFLLLGKGEEAQGGRERSSSLANAFEALLGAIYLDGGFEAAYAWVERVFSNRWPDAPVLEQQRDYKSLLQEATQQFFKARPVYLLVESSGPEHDKIFEVKLELPDGRSVQASGSSMKKAEQKAAGLALELLTEKRPDNPSVAE